MKGKKIKALVFAAAMLFSTVGAACMQPMSCHAEETDLSSYEQLDELYKDYFKMGVACEAISHWNNRNSEVGNPAKEALMAHCFNSMTFGNEFKPAYNFDPNTEGLFKVDRAAEEMLDWAKENGMKVRGHVMVWHSQVSPNFFAKDFKALSGGIPTNSDQAKLDEDCLVDRDTLIERLKTYIYHLMEYTYANGYADTIYAWDVVNEASDEGQSDGLRRSYWYKIIGPDFLYYAFLYAREAETIYAKQYADLYGLNAETDDLSSIMPKLFYNDYNEWFDARCNHIIRFLTEDKWNEGHKMVQSDVIKPDGDGTIYGDGLIDGIGMQGHLDDTQNLDQYMKALNKYSAAVDEVHITELDVGATRKDENIWYYQANFFYRFFARLMEEVENGAKLTSVTIWGLTDDNSWRKDANPLLFYGDLSRKPAFNAIVMAANKEEFNMTLAQTLQEVKETTIDFEPYSNGGKMETVDPQNVGIYRRGTGHQAELSLKAKTNHTEGAGLGFSLRVNRAEKDATIKLDLSRYAGKIVKLTAYVQSEDAHFYMGIDGDEPTVIAEIAPVEGWNELVGYYAIPEDAPVCYAYFETDGNADMYLDDIMVQFATEEEMLAAEQNKNENSENGSGETESVVEESQTETADKETTAPTETRDVSGGAVALFVLVAAAVVAAGVLAGRRARK